MVVATKKQFKRHLILFKKQMDFKVISGQLDE